MHWRYGILMAIVWVGCSKAPTLPDTTDSPIDTADYSGLWITVKHLYAINPVKEDSLLPGVSVELYRTAQDRTDRLAVYQQLVSDTNGKVLFGKILDGTYYILAIDDSLGSLEEEVDVSGGALELLELLYLP